MNQIVLSPVRRYKISNNNLQQRQSTRFEAEDSNAIDTVRLQEKLNCSKQWVKQFYNTHSELLSETSDVLKNVELLLANGVKTGVVLDNPKMLTLSNSELRTNLRIVQGMKPIDINDFVPLVQVSNTKLLKLKKIAEKDKYVTSKKHRIYHISEAMGIEPHEVTKFISRVPNVLTLPYQKFEENLQILLKYIAPTDLLHDLWAFRYKASTIEKRLNRAREGNVDKFMPWMIRCTEKKLAASIKIVSDTKAIAGKKPLVKYLSERLNYDVKTTEAIMRRHPKIFNCRVSRVKEMLDYSFDVGFEPVDFAGTPRVFSYSLTTIRQRVNELKSIGCRPQFSIICRSSNNYNNFVENWLRVREELKEKNIVKE